MIAESDPDHRDTKQIRNIFFKNVFEGFVTFFHFEKFGTNSGKIRKYFTDGDNKPTAVLADQKSQDIDQIPDETMSDNSSHSGHLSSD